MKRYIIIFKDGRTQTVEMKNIKQVKKYITDAGLSLSDIIIETLSY